MTSHARALPDILFMKGSKDSLCPLEKLDAVRKKMNSVAEMYVVEGGDHSFKIGKKHLQTTGSTQEEAENLAVQAISTFVSNILEEKWYFTDKIIWLPDEMLMIWELLYIHFVFVFFGWNWLESLYFQFYLVSIDCLWHILNYYFWTLGYSLACKISDPVLVCLLHRTSGHLLSVANG